MTSHKPHHTYRIAPSTDLRRSANAAFRAADCHLVAMKKLFRSGQTKHAEFDADAFYRELRSFFWELASSYEIMLHWTNRAFTPGIDEHKVCPKTVLVTTPKRALSPEDQTRLAAVRSKLKDAYDSAWHYEIRQYRNFYIHRGYMSITSIVTMPEPFEKHRDAPVEEGTLTCLQMYPVREDQKWGGDMFPYLDTYLQEMGRLGKSIFTDTV